MKVGNGVFSLWLKSDVRSCGSRRGRERGAALVEFAGMAIVVAVIIGGVIAVAPSHGRNISCSILSKISEAIGAGEMQCGGGENKAEEDEHKPTEACTNSRQTQSVKGSAGVAVVSVEVKGDIVVEKLSDGRYRVTDARATKVGESLGGGGGFEVIANNQKFGQYLNADGTASGAVEAGFIYEVDSEKAKNDLVDHLYRKAAVEGVSSVGSFGSLAAPINEAISHYVFGYQPPKPTAAYLQVGEEGSVSAESTQGVGGVQAEGSYARALGVKADREAGTTTMYYKTNAGVSGNASKLGFGVEGSASGEAIIAVTVNSDDPNKVLNVSATGTYDAQIGATTPLGVGNPPSLESGQVWTASVDLNSVEADRMARNFLTAAKVPGYENGKGALENLGDATSTFINAAADRGVLARQDISTTSSNYEAKLGVKLELELSAGVGYSDENVEFSNGQYYSGGKWNRWEGC